MCRSYGGSVCVHVVCEQVFLVSGLPVSSTFYHRYSNLRVSMILWTLKACHTCRFFSGCVMVVGVL